MELVPVQAESGWN